MRIAKGIFFFLILIYVIACGSLYFVQDELWFNPTILPDSHTFRSGEEVNIEVEENVELNCLWMKEAPHKGVLLYLHGNRGSNRRCWRQAQNIAGNQYDIFMPDYRGYGKSDGVNSSEEQFFSDMQKVYDFLLQHYREEEIIVVGYSLGTAPSTYLAANNNPRHLILVAPFISFINLKNRILPIIPSFIIKYPFRNNRNLKKVNCPVTMFHGTEDEVIPFDSSEKLVAINPDKFNLIPIRGEGHRGAIFDRVYQNGVARILQQY